MAGLKKDIENIFRKILKMTKGEVMDDRMNLFDMHKEFFWKAIHYHACDEVFHTNHIEWISVFQEDGINMVIGISKSGEWVLKNENHFYILNNKAYFLYCAKLLEIPYDIVFEKLRDRFGTLLEYMKMNVSDIFPFFEIVESAFANLLDDYWFELSWKWYENLSLAKRMKLIDLLDTISHTKKFSQKNRQKARKEVNRLNKIRVSL